MNPKKTISDELLAKYLDGKTTPEETELVLQYLSENDEHITELADICEAIEVQHDTEKIVRRRTPRTRWWLVAPVAAAVALLVILLTLPYRNLPQGGGELVAEQTDTIPDVTQTEDAAVPLESDDRTDSSSSKSARTVQKAVPPKIYAGTEAKTDYVNLIYPYKTIHYISSGRKSVDFRWDSDAINVHLIIKDGKSNLLYDKVIKGEDHCYWPVPSIEEPIFDWQLIFTFADGTTAMRKGRFQDENHIID